MEVRNSRDRDDSAEYNRFSCLRRMWGHKVSKEKVRDVIFGEQHLIFWYLIQERITTICSLR